MKTLVNRYYYSLADLTEHDSPVASPMTTFDYMLREIKQLWSGGAILPSEQTMFQDYLWPEFYESPIFYVDVESAPWFGEEGEEPELEDVIEQIDPLLGRLHRWYVESKERYVYLIGKLEAIKANLLARVESVTTSQVKSSDTPQISTDPFDLEYVSRADQSTVTLASDISTPIERFREVQEKLRNLYADWANEFSQFVIQSAE